MPISVRLKDFDGPLDLLLHLVTKAKINIRDIFVSEITDQYIEAVRSADDLDMDDASEFLVLAAALLEIKSRALLPRPPRPAGEEDPEEKLIRQLEEYKRYKESAVAMRGFENAARFLYTKLPDEFPLPPQEVELVGLSLEGLTEAFLRMWARVPETPPEPLHPRLDPRNIHRDEHTVQDCMHTLLKGVRALGALRFEEAFSEAPTREEVVTLFLALLELLKLGMMHVQQDSVCGELMLLHGPAPMEPEEEQDLGGAEGDWDAQGAD